VALGSEQVATGHYARVEYEERSARFALRRGADPARDQSYFLFSLTQDQLARASFPVGGLSKDAVRQIARERRLPVADKPDSREICFVPDGDHTAFVERHAASAPAPGVIADRSGRIVGRHDGVHRFTVGQRKGLRLSSTVPLYVLAIDAESSTITVGPREALEQATVRASRVNWISSEPPSGRVRAAAQIRHKHLEAPGWLSPVGSDTATFEFDEPQAAVTPGQAVVFYDGDTVLGGGWIE
jgi:tRNA-specific 2-thiouridylase